MKKTIMLLLITAMYLSGCVADFDEPTAPPSLPSLQATSSASASPEATAEPAALYVLPASLFYGDKDFAQYTVDIANKDGDSARVLEDGSVEITTTREKQKLAMESQRNTILRYIKVEIRDNGVFSQIEMNDDCTEIKMYTTPAKTFGMDDRVLESYCRQMLLYQYNAGLLEAEASATLIVLDEVTGNQLDHVIYPRDLERFPSPSFISDTPSPTK